MKSIRLQEYLVTLGERRAAQALKICERELRDEGLDPKTGKKSSVNPWW